MTGEEIYVRGRQRWWDRVLFYSYLPSLLFFIMIGVTLIGVAVPQDWQLTRIPPATKTWAVLFGIWVPVVAAARSWYAARVERFRREYAQMDY